MFTGSTEQILSIINNNDSPRKSVTPVLYKILGVEQTATMDEIKIAYKKLVLIFHPDKGGDEEEFKKIQHAYNVLKDPVTRAEYDAALNDEEAEKNYRKESFDDWCSRKMDESEQELKLRRKEKSNVIFLSDKFFDPLILKTGEIYYITGQPISVLAGEKKVFRETIPDEDIIQSFPNTGVVRIMENKYAALQYIRATRIGDIYEDNVCLQSALARVRLKQDLDSETKWMQILVNERYKGKIEGIENKCKARDTGVTMTNARYIEIDRSYIELLSMEMIIHTLFKYKEYPRIQIASIDDDHDNNNNSENHGKGCLMM
jgi:hypothetical protein